MSLLQSVALNKYKSKRSNKATSNTKLCEERVSSDYLLFLLLSCPVPDEPPAILAVKPITTTSVMVQWKVHELF